MMQQHQQQDVRVRTLKCLRYIADRCDGAYLADGEGFSKYDAEFGHSLAAQHQLSLRQLEIAAKLSRRYRRQLADGGLQPPSEAEVLLYLQQHGFSSKSRSRRPAPQTSSPNQPFFAQPLGQQQAQQPPAQQWLTDDLLHDQHREMASLYGSRHDQITADTSRDLAPNAQRLKPRPEKPEHWSGRHLIALALALIIGILCWRWSIWLALLLSSLVFILIECIL